VGQLADLLVDREGGGPEHVPLDGGEGQGRDRRVFAVTGGHATAGVRAHSEHWPSADEQLPLNQSSPSTGASSPPHVKNGTVDDRFKAS
jgi:hypothetical protein